MVEQVHGTSTAGIVFGGKSPPTSLLANAENWNGSAWTEVTTDLNTARGELAGVGTILYSSYSYCRYIPTTNRC